MRDTFLGLAEYGGMKTSVFFRHLGLIASLLLGAVASAVAQAIPAPVDLSPPDVAAAYPDPAAQRGQSIPPSSRALNDAAKVPFQSGLIAAQQQDWKLAIRYFLEAHRADPDAPQIWFNLGLASSKLPGYELRALTWFQAYLLAVPDAPNAGVIRQLIPTLEVTFESRMGKIIEGLESVPPVLTAAAQTTDNLARRAEILGKADSAVHRLATARAFLGDTTGLLRYYRQQFPTGGPWGCFVEEVFAGSGRAEPPDNIPDTYSRQINEIKLGCSPGISYFLEAGDLRDAQQYARSDHFIYRGFHDWERIACEAFDRRDEKALQNALEKAAPVAAPTDDYSKRYHVHLALLLLAVGKRDQAHVVVLNAFPNSENAQALFQLDNIFEQVGEPGEYPIVGLLVAVGEDNRADLVSRPKAELFRSHQKVLPDPCVMEENWWGRNRVGYLTQVAATGVKLNDCPGPVACGNFIDETQLVEFLRRSQDTLGGPESLAAGNLLISIAQDLDYLTEAYRKVHGPYATHGR